MLYEVLDRPLKPERVLAEVAETDIALETEQPTDLARGVVVIDVRPVTTVGLKRLHADRTFNLRVDKSPEGLFGEPIPSSVLSPFDRRLDAALMKLVVLPFGGKNLLSLPAVVFPFLSETTFAILVRHWYIRPTPRNRGRDG